MMRRPRVSSGGSVCSRGSQTTSFDCVPENDLNQSIDDNYGVFNSLEEPILPLDMEEKLADKVSILKEIVQIELALMTVAFSYLYTNVWHNSSNRRNYLLFNFCILTPFILWLAGVCSSLVITLVLGERLFQSVKTQFSHLAPQPPLEPSSAMFPLSRRTSSASGGVPYPVLTTVTCSGSCEQLARLLKYERRSSLPAPFSV